jgi:hypothetical protein
MQMTNLALEDYFNIPNALLHLQDPVEVDAKASFDITWSGPISDRSSVSDASQRLSGDFLLNQADITWSASNETGFSFVSNPSGTTSVFAQLGHMQNGVFFDG